MKYTWESHSLSHKISHFFRYSVDFSRKEIKKKTEDTNNKKFGSMEVKESA